MKNERRAFEYHFAVKCGNSRALLKRDPDNPASYADPSAALMWAGWRAGVESFAKRKGLRHADE